MKGGALYVCRMNTATLDKCMYELDVSFARDHQAVVRATERAAKQELERQGMRRSCSGRTRTQTSGTVTSRWRSVSGSRGQEV